MVKLINGRNNFNDQITLDFEHILASAKRKPMEWFLDVE